MSDAEREDDVGRSLKRRGDMSKAPKNSCGCEHHAMSEMSILDREHMVAYIGTDKKPGILYGVSCAHKGCPHGLLSLQTWPRSTAVGVTYGVFCQYVARRELVGNEEKQRCTFVCCNDCKIKREKEEENMNGEFNRRGGRRSRKRRKLTQ